MTTPDWSKRSRSTGGRQDRMSTAPTSPSKNGVTIAAISPSTTQDTSECTAT